MLFECQREVSPALFRPHSLAKHGAHWNPGRDLEKGIGWAVPPAHWVASLGGAQAPALVSGSLDDAVVQLRVGTTTSESHRGAPRSLTLGYLSLPFIWCFSICFLVLSFVILFLPPRVDGTFPTSSSSPCPLALGI